MIGPEKSLIFSDLCAGGSSLTYRFERYCLDTERRELRRGADLIAVEPQVFDLLEYLIRNRDRVVGKDDLIAGVWSGRIVSESTLSSRITAARQAIGDSGEQQRFIRTIPRKGIRFVGAVSDAEVVPLPLPAKPSIAILPFANLSESPEQQEYFVDGVVEEVITALSQLRWLFVIARSSTFIYKGRAIDVKEVGRQLGVHYVIEGSVRKAGSKVRITAQLIDAMNGSHLWADRFDGGLEDIFDLQNQIAASIVGAIAPKLEEAEIERSRRKPTDSLGAYDFYLRATAHFHRMTRESMQEALRLFYKAIELDEAFASAYGMAAYCHVWRKTNSWATDREHEIAEAARLSRLAAEFGQQDAVALGTGGFALGHVVGDLDGGAEMIDKATILNPNLATLWLLSGWIRTYLSEPEIAIEHVTRAMRLSPFDPQAFVTHLVVGFAHFIAGRYEEAALWAEKALREQPHFAGSARVAAASNAYLGRTERAQMAMARLRQIDPSLRVSNLKYSVPLRDPNDFARLAEGLRKAGLTE